MSRIEIYQDDLLPGAQRQAAIDDRDREARTEQRCAGVRVAVVIVPGLLVQVPAVLGCNSFKEGFEVVMDQAGFEFRRRDRCGGADDKHRGRSHGDRAFGDATNNLIGDVEDVVVSSRLNPEFVGLDLHEDECRCRLPVIKRYRRDHRSRMLQLARRCRVSRDHRHRRHRAS